MSVVLAAPAPRGVPGKLLRIAIAIGTSVALLMAYLVITAGPGTAAAVRLEADRSERLDARMRRLQARYRRTRAQGKRGLHG
jgi:hypothetical protein